MINNVVSLMEYSIALELDGNSAEAHLGTGKVLLAKKDFANAVSELKQAADLGPSVAANHDLYAQALQATGKTDSFSLDPKQLQVQLELASALEKKGDWVSAMDQYLKASLADAAIDIHKKVFRTDERNPQEAYNDGQDRFRRISSH